MPPKYHAGVERSTTLEAAPASARAARRFVADALADWRLLDVVETAELLVSELVTNALLHARTSVELLARRSGGTLRVEVRDASDALPATRAHHQESLTGRGLELVEMLADSWGVDVHHGGGGVTGKGVWFELSTAGSTTPGAVFSVTARAPGRVGHASTVCLEGVPTALFRESQEHRAGLTREFLLMTIHDGASHGVPARLVAISEEVAVRFAGESATTLAQVSDAEVRGDATVDLVLELTAADAGPLEAIVDLLEEADRYCGQGAMLTMAATAEIQAFRRWCVDEVTAQLNGRPGSPWRSGPE